MRGKYIADYLLVSHFGLLFHTDKQTKSKTEYSPILFHLCDNVNNPKMLHDIRHNQRRSTVSNVNNNNNDNNSNNVYEYAERFCSVVIENVYRCVKKTSFYTYTSQQVSVVLLWFSLNR